MIITRCNMKRILNKGKILTYNYLISTFISCNKVKINELDMAIFYLRVIS